MFRSLAAALLAICVAGSALAQNAPPPTRIRGTIVSYFGQTLTVKSREGQQLEIVLAADVKLASLKKIALSSIGSGNYVGIATRKGKDGTPQAIEVLVFPEAMRGAGEGHYAWDLEPESMMTNGNVDGVASPAVGRDLTVSYKGEKIVIHVPDDAPVVTFAPAAPSDLKPGAAIFLSATKDANDRLTAARVTVAKDGVNPPM